MDKRRDAILVPCANPGPKDGGRTIVSHQTRRLRRTSGVHITVPRNHAAGARLYDLSQPQSSMSGLHTVRAER